MASPLAALFDKRNVALTRARFRAWWEGAEFDEEAALAAIEAAANAEPAQGIGDDADLFEPEAPQLSPRLVALSTLWGAGRVRPGDETAEKLTPALLGVRSEDQRVALLGPGLSAPVRAFAATFPGQIAVFEWREETAETLAQMIAAEKLGARVTVQRIDLDAYAFEPEGFDGLWSLEEFTYADEPTRLAHRIARALKPDACCVIEAYAGFPSPDIAPAFATSFAEPQIRAAGDIAHFLIESGLKIEAQDDLTEEHIGMARQAFRRLETQLTQNAALDAVAARELAWEAETWRSRLKLLTRRRLERRRVIARRPPG